jgi:3-hydroxyacyl-[acyl-carrier-protein] dehydratase
MDAPGLSREQILPRVQTILRRDLKLGADAPIPPDMPFFGSDMDLDSLDILLLVTSVEKEFGVKIPSSEIGKEVFQNVTTLTNYIAKHAGESSVTGSPGSAATAGAATATATATADPLAHLPHRDPFRFVSSVTEATRGESAEGAWNVTGTEDFFRGHFPGDPVVPGVLIAEALAQLSGLAGAAEGKSGMIAHVDVRFERPVAPPATIVLRSKRSGGVGRLEVFEVSASVGDLVVARGSITLHRST